VVHGAAWGLFAIAKGGVEENDLVRRGHGLALSIWR
jgi:hypothetical protein